MSSLSVKLPLERDSSDGFQMNKSFISLIRQNFKMLLLTSPGERVMEPDFGVGIKRYLFENFGQATYQNIDSRIRSQVAKYLPVVLIQEINFSQMQNDNNLLSLSISYSIPSIADSDLIEITI